ncbi:uroporphyrinogen-III synthase [Rhodoferax sp. PAMC 29310]|uniref:uroporphyrinogen-III synthase n=1 Tax=Rhodoferax sp. PAMC 29310 TaxID=2822760 RepID=UPI001B32A878|nr:uroporphyrinogen-III synthase [Rhodoferax sp. PAMC 29310]
MRVIVTRPDRDARVWVRDLLASGYEAAALPLIQIGAIADVSPVVNAWGRLHDYVGVMFVSGNAVDYFFSAKPSSAKGFKHGSTSKTRAWATGPGTSRALLRAGLESDCVDAPDLASAQFDSENLWLRVSHQVHAGDRVLIVRGSDGTGGNHSIAGSGRDWFANRLSSVGAAADFVATYQRSSPQFSPADVAMARHAAEDGAVWLLSSTEAVANLKAWLPQQSWGHARALATHPRIAAAAKAAGFGVVQESRPTLAAVVASIESMT